RQTDDLRATHVETDVHPGFVTDWQQPFVVLLTQSEGVSVIHETVYENRFGYTRTLREMGASIDLASACLGSKPCRFAHHDHLHSCIVRGPMPLKGRAIEIPDLRAGFAYLIAAMVAEGVSEVGGIRYVERGYAAVPEKLRALGVNIEVETHEPAIVEQASRLPKGRPALEPTTARTPGAAGGTPAPLRTEPRSKAATSRKSVSKRKPE